MAASGAASARIAAELGSRLFATEQKPEIVEAWHGHGGSGAPCAEAPLAWAPTEQAASSLVTPDAVRGQFAVGPDVEQYVRVVQQYVDARFDHVVTQNAGPDPDGSLDFSQRELRDRVRALAPSHPGVAERLADAVREVLQRGGQGETYGR